jgi:hypothetical protein
MQTSNKQKEKEKRGIHTSGTPLARSCSISAICAEVKRVGDVEARVMMREKKSKTETRDGMVGRAMMDCWRIEGVEIGWMKGPG